MKNRIFLASALVLSASFIAACGGDQKQPKSPESNAGITETSAKEDMPPPPKEGADPAAAPATDAKAAAPAGPTGGVIKVAAMKLTPAKKGKTGQLIEVKDDGSVNVDGKPAAKIKGDSVDSAAGTSMVTIGLDGSLVGNGVKPGYKFDNDDNLTNDNGSKLSVGDDGTITSTNKDGKSDTIGKADGGSSAKRAALIAAVLFMTIPDASAATPAKVTSKKAGGGDKATTTSTGAGKKQKKQ